MVSKILPESSPGAAIITDQKAAGDTEKTLTSSREPFANHTAVLCKLLGRAKHAMAFDERGRARTGLGEEVGSELGGDGLASLGFTVGSRVTVVGDDCRDGARAGALACVNGD